jgi:hypothetical protein
MRDFLLNSDAGELLKKVKNGKLFYTPFKTTYADWVAAVKTAILKRCEPLDQISVDLSSGYETGVIFSEVAKLNRPFVAITVVANEDLDVIEQRVERVPHCSHKMVGNTYEDIQRNVNYIKASGALKEYYQEFKNCGNPYLLTSSGGELNTARLNEEVKQVGKTIRLSGLGDQYMLEDFTGRFERDTKEMDFFTQMLYPLLWSNVVIDKAYGIETRYPFLDVRVVQEYLYLTDSMKDVVRKAPMEHLLALNDIPVMKNAPGFHIPEWSQPIQELYEL